jgi:Tfp pilus assembly protein PilX
MKRPAVQSRRGIALVITLIMLSVVTITAVAFLAVSRRERGAVAANGEQIDARLAADTALSRVKAELASWINISGNRASLGLMVSTNYQNPKPNFAGNYSYAGTANFDNLTNVNYYQNPLTQQPWNLTTDAGREAYYKMLANLYYDPRPPVFVPTNSGVLATPDFRFYLDLNRNGRFETNGWQLPRDNNNNPVSANPEFMVGDPEWIGVLEHSDVPHSGTNRFTARYAYLVLPAGRQMDVNYVFNSAKNRGSLGPLLGESFMRNQGVGGWELNLAGFLADLNTNAWPTTGSKAYQYQIAHNTASQGAAFDDAGEFLLARRRSLGVGVAYDTAPINANLFFQRETGNPADGSAQRRLKNSPVDWYSDGTAAGGPIRDLADILTPPAGNDDPTKTWSGGDYTNAFKELNQYFDPTLGLGAKLAGVDTVNSGQNLNRTYDRYTFYRLLAQLGTDGPDARFESGFDRSQTNAFYRRAKLNLNFRQESPGGSQPASASVAGLQDWTPLGWFTNAAHRLLLTEFTNGLAYPLPSGGTVAGIPVQGLATNWNPATGNYYTTATGYSNIYTAQLHRLLQVAANIYDYTINATNVNGKAQAFPFLPSVFQPILYRDPVQSLIRIAGYTPVTNATQFLNQPWLDMAGYSTVDPTKPGYTEFAESQAFNRLFNPRSVNLGDLPGTQARFVDVPVVIGAKKGLPNFNEAFWQATLQVTRRLSVTKPTPTSKLPPGVLPFNGAGQGHFVTRAQYYFCFTNQFAAEAWNSYSAKFYPKGFPRGSQLIATNVLSYGLYQQTGNSSKLIQGSGNYLVRGARFNVPALGWPGSQFTNVFNPATALFATNFFYDYVLQQQVTNSINNPVAGFEDVSLYAPPVLNLFVTNRLMYALVETNSNVLLDYVSFKSVMAETNVLRFFGAAGQPKVGGLRLTPSTTFDMPDIWRTDLAPNMGKITVGIENQMLAALGLINVPRYLWTDPLQTYGVGDLSKATNGFYYFLYQTLPPNSPFKNASQLDQNKYVNTTSVQLGFNPSPTLYLTDRLQANDPLVHYTREDLAPGYSLFTDSGNYSELPGPYPPNFRLTSLNSNFQLTTNLVANYAGQSLANKLSARAVVAYAPWGMDPQLRLAAGRGTGGTRFNLYYKDPQITNSDAWSFPTNARTLLPNIGWLGRVHRGTPWQTLYLKSAPVIGYGQNFVLLPLGSPIDRVTAQQSWAAWSGSPATYPINDWKFLDLFTTAVNDNAARGLMSVNQTNIAAWSALLSGVSVLDTSGTVSKASSATNPDPFELQPNSPELRKILAGYTNNNNVVVPGLLQVLAGTNAAATNRKVPVLPIAQSTTFTAGGSFTNLGSILSVPTLSDRAPFLFDSAKANWSTATRMTDEVIERLPQQILSLLRADEPRVVVYSFGQSLKPAINSFVTRPGYYYGLCTNYQITGEFVTKTTLRFDGAPGNLNAVVEDHRVIYPSN